MKDQLSLDETINSSIMNTNYFVDNLQIKDLQADSKFSTGRLDKTTFREQLELESLEPFRGELYFNQQTPGLKQIS